MSHHVKTEPLDVRASRRVALQRGLLTLAGLGLAASGCSSRRTSLDGGGFASSQNALAAWEGRAAREPDVAVPPPGAWAPLRENAPPTSGVVARAQWAQGQPVPRLMDPMKPIRRITIHHDGMSAFTYTSKPAAAQRVEAIRLAHRSRNWGDIGYHYLIDPHGRVWEGRPLDWQGAHVAAQNEGNLGICVMGNYEIQRPNARQVQALERFVAAQMRHYRIPTSNVHTHRELASTACPGRHLQPRVDGIRASGPVAAAV